MLNSSSSSISIDLTSGTYISGISIDLITSSPKSSSSPSILTIDCFEMIPFLGGETVGDWEGGDVLCWSEGTFIPE